MLMSNTAHPLNKSPVWTNQRSRMLRYLLQPRLQLLLHFHCVICLVFSKGLLSQKNGTESYRQFRHRYFIRNKRTAVCTLKTSAFLWRFYITFLPTGWFWFVLCNRESHSNQAASGKFLLGYKEPLIHGNALGLWCVYTESITVNYWQLWNRLLLQDMEWVQRLQKKTEKKTTQHSHCSSKKIIKQQ